MLPTSKAITTYKPEYVLQPILSGAAIALDDSGKVLATCLGEESIITDLSSGQVLARVEGVSLFEGLVCTTDNWAGW